MRFFIDLSYDGSKYHGWQKQPNALGIQEVLEECFAKIFGSFIPLTGAGRTDTGVHARQLIAHFDTLKSLKTQDLVYKLNRMLPTSIAVNQVYRVKNEAHARFDAISREYQYYLTTKKDPFLQHYACFIPKSIDINLMNEACEVLKSHKNFQCFSKVKTDVNTYNCTIKNAFWVKENHQYIFTIKADRFLRNMVRAIVGTLIEIGNGQKTIADLKQILASKDRCQAGKSFAAKGLFLNQIEYPKTIREF